MRIKPKNPDGYLDEPYHSLDEPFSRLDLSNRLTNLYANLDHGSVAILNGRWGSGKSTFANKWAADLRSKGFGTIYFDAFANDYISDPFVALNAALISSLNSLPDGGGETSTVFKRTATAVSKRLLIAGAKVGVKAASLGALSLADLNLSDDLTSSASDTVGDLAEAAAKKWGLYT